MLVYNVSIVVDESVLDEWLEWMTEKHMPNVMATNCFSKSVLYRVVSPEPEEGEGETFVTQYFANSVEDYERYQIEHAAILQAEHKEKFGRKFTAFRTLMEEVQA
jgi:hypothetical protein